MLAIQNLIFKKMLLLNDQFQTRISFKWSGLSFGYQNSTELTVQTSYTFVDLKKLLKRHNIKLSYYLTAPLKQEGVETTPSLSHR